MNNMKTQTSNKPSQCSFNLYKCLNYWQVAKAAIIGLPFSKPKVTRMSSILGAIGLNSRARIFGLMAGLFLLSGAAILTRAHPYQAHPFTPL